MAFQPSVFGALPILHSWGGGGEFPMATPMDHKPRLIIESQIRREQSCLTKMRCNKTKTTAVEKNKSITLKILGV